MGAGCSDGSYCVPQVVQIQACFTTEPLGASSSLRSAGLSSGAQSPQATSIMACVPFAPQLSVTCGGGKLSAHCDQGHGARLRGAIWMNRCKSFKGTSVMNIRLNGLTEGNADDLGFDVSDLALERAAAVGAGELLTIGFCTHWYSCSWPLSPVAVRSESTLGDRVLRA